MCIRKRNRNKQGCLPIPSTLKDQNFDTQKGNLLHQHRCICVSVVSGWDLVTHWVPKLPCLSTKNGCAPAFRAVYTHLCASLLHVSIIVCTWVCVCVCVCVCIPCSAPVHCRCQSRSTGPFSAQVVIDWPLMSPYGTVWERCVLMFLSVSLCVSPAGKVSVRHRHWCSYHVYVHFKHQNLLRV